jgi:DNA primase
MAESEEYLLGALEVHLGRGRKTSHDNYSFHCPFCNHKKPKLEIDLNTNDKGENKYACWVCGTKGRKISKLLKLLKVSKEDALNVLKYVKKGTVEEYYQAETRKGLTLPAEFKPLVSSTDTSNTFKRARHYLASRGVFEPEIRKYQIGYADSGEYAGRIIIPSYNEFGVLDFYIGRSIQDAYVKYLKPEIESTDFIFFDSFINWNKPVVLCEGVFDAMAIKINAVPLLGKFAKSILKRRILEFDTPMVYVALDQDAKKEAVKLGEDLMRLGIRVGVIDLESKDPAQIGYENFKKYLNGAKELDTKTILNYKLQNI